MRLILLKKAAASLTVTVFGVGAAFALDVVMARWMSSYEFGVTRSCMSLIMVLSSVLALGSGQAIVRSYARGADRAPSSAQRDLTANEYRALAGLLCAVLLAGLSLSWLLFSTQTLMVAPLAIAVVLSGLRAIYIVDRAALIADSRVWSAQFTDRILMFPIAIAVLAACVTIISIDAASGLAAYGFGLMLSALLAAYFARDIHRAQPKPCKLVTVRARGAAIAASVPYMMEDLVGMALRHAPVLALGLAGRVREAAIYAVAARIADLVLLAQASGNIAAAPMLARAYERGDRRGILVASGVVSAFYIASALLLAVLLLVGGGLLTEIFGAEYTGAVPIAMWIIAARAMAATFGVNGQLLLMSGHAKENATVSAAAALAMVLTLAALIPLDALIGATAGTLAGILVLGFGAWWVCVRKTGINLWVPHPQTVKELARSRG